MPLDDSKENLTVHWQLAVVRVRWIPNVRITYWASLSLSHTHTQQTPLGVTLRLRNFTPPYRNSLYFLLLPEMNREIASAPEKSEASFCARRTAAVLRPSMEPWAHFPDWSLERAHGAGRGKREKTAPRLGASDAKRWRIFYSLGWQLHIR